jgi:hypothetical protein
LYYGLSPKGKVRIYFQERLTAGAGMVKVSYYHIDFSIRFEEIIRLGCVLVISYTKVFKKKQGWFWKFENG